MTVTLTCRFKGERFICQNCGYEEHADIVGAINIALKVLAKDQQVNLENLLRADVSRPNAPRLG